MTIYCGSEVTGSFRCTLLFFPDCRVSCDTVWKNSITSVRTACSYFVVSYVRSLPENMCVCVCVCVCFYLFFIFCRFRRTVLTAGDFGHRVYVCACSPRVGDKTYYTRGITPTDISTDKRWWYDIGFESPSRMRSGGVVSGYVYDVKKLEKRVTVVDGVRKKIKTKCVYIYMFMWIKKTPKLKRWLTFSSVGSLKVFCT